MPLGIVWFITKISSCKMKFKLKASFIMKLFIKSIWMICPGCLHGGELGVLIGLRQDRTIRQVKDTVPYMKPQRFLNFFQAKN